MNSLGANGEVSHGTLVKSDTYLLTLVLQFRSLLYWCKIEVNQNKKNIGKEDFKTKTCLCQMR